MTALPFLAAILRRRMHRTLRVGPLARFGARRGQGLRPLAPDPHVRAIASPKADDANKSCSELGSSQRSTLQRSVGDSTGQSVIGLTRRRTCLGYHRFCSGANTPLRFPYFSASAVLMAASFVPLPASSAPFPISLPVFLPVRLPTRAVFCDAFLVPLAEAVAALSVERATSFAALSVP